MPKKLIKKYMPDHRVIREHKHLQFFGELLHDSNLWHFNRRSVSGAFAVGLFCAFVPIPFQMILAAAIAIATRVNLPISVSLVWISNPITMPPMFYGAYKLGAYLTGCEPLEMDFILSWQWMSSQMAFIWQPFLLGCLILGTTTAVISYFTIRLLWRLHVIQHLKKRKLRRKKNI
jgi:uncharacterized protein (DUF2062 family)